MQKQSFELREKFLQPLHLLCHSTEPLLKDVFVSSRGVPCAEGARLNILKETQIKPTVIIMRDIW